MITQQQLSHQYRSIQRTITFSASNVLGAVNTANHTTVSVYVLAHIPFCRWTSCLELSADGPQTAGLVTQTIQRVSEDTFNWSVRPKRSVNRPFNCTLEIVLLTFCTIQ